jgi:hypothetical protein
LRGWSALRPETVGRRRLRNSNRAVTIATSQSSPISGQVQREYGSRNAGAVPPVPTLIAIGSSTKVSDTVTTSTTARTIPSRILTPGA